MHDAAARLQSQLEGSPQASCSAGNNFSLYWSPMARCFSTSALSLRLQQPPGMQMYRSEPMSPSMLE